MTASGSRALPAWPPAWRRCLAAEREGRSRAHVEAAAPHLHLDPPLSAGAVGRGRLEADQVIAGELAVEALEDARAGAGGNLKQAPARLARQLLEAIAHQVVVEREAHAGRTGPRGIAHHRLRGPHDVERHPGFGRAPRDVHHAGGRASEVEAFGDHDDVDRCIQPGQPDEQLIEVAQRLHCPRAGFGGGGSRLDLQCVCAGRKAHLGRVRRTRARRRAPTCRCRRSRARRLR